MTTSVIPGVNIVREHPYYSRLPNCKMEEKIKEIENKLTNQKFAALHTAMSTSKGNHSNHYVNTMITLTTMTTLLL